MTKVKPAAWIYDALVDNKFSKTVSLWNPIANMDARNIRPLYERSPEADDLQAQLDASEAKVAELVGGVGKNIEMLMHGYAPFVEGALSEAMCCSGQMCGCRGASVGEYLAHLLLQDTGLAHTTPDADDAGGV